MLTRIGSFAAFFCLVLFLAFSSNSFAGGMTLGEISGTYVADAKSDEAGKNTEIQRTITRFSIKHIHPIATRINLIWGVDYTSQSVSYSNFSSFSFDGKSVVSSDLPEDLHALDITFGYQTVINNFKTTFVFKPGIHGDFHGVDEDHIVYQGSFLAEKKFGKKNIWGFGAFISDNLGDEQILPLARLFWYPSNNWFIETTLPKDFRAGYRLSKNSSVGLAANLYGYQYRLTKGPFDGEVLSYKEIQLGPFYEYKFSQGRGLFRLRGGVSAGQNFEFKDKDNDKTISEGDLQSAGFVSLSLRYRF